MVVCSIAWPFLASSLLLISVLKPDMGSSSKRNKWRYKTKRKCRRPLPQRLDVVVNKPQNVGTAEVTSQVDDPVVVDDENGNETFTENIDSVEPPVKPFKDFNFIMNTDILNYIVELLGQPCVDCNEYGNRSVNVEPQMLRYKTRSITANIYNLFVRSK